MLNFFAFHRIDFQEISKNLFLPFKLLFIRRVFVLLAPLGEAEGKLA